MIYHLTRYELAGLPVGASVMKRGKELPADGTVAEARRLFRSSEVLVVPVLDGRRYVGAVDRAAIPDEIPDGASLTTIVDDRLPVARASTPTEEALAQLDRTGGQRLVVLEDDDITYHGIVCLRTDRVRLCVDAARLEPYLDDIPTRARNDHR